MTCIGTRTRRRGFVLLMVVVLIAIAAMILARLASTSLRVASVAVEEEREMRERWAVTSLRRYSFETAPRLFAGPSDPDSDEGARAVFWQDVRLAGETWKIVVAEESAKLNLAMFRGQIGSDDWSTDVELLLETDSVRLKSSIESPRLRWGDWLESAGSSRSPSAEAVATATQRITLWGDGRLNVMQCDDETLGIVWRRQFGHAPPAVLHQMRSQQPRPTTQQMMAALDLRDSQRDKANNWITAESRCYSTWVFCRTSHRVPASLFVEWGQSGAAKEHRGYQY